MLNQQRDAGLCLLLFSWYHYLSRPWIIYSPRFEFTPLFISYLNPSYLSQRKKQCYCQETFPGPSHLHWSLSFYQIPSLGAHASLPLRSLTHHEWPQTYAASPIHWRVSHARGWFPAVIWSDSPGPVQQSVSWHFLRPSTLWPGDFVLQSVSPRIWHKVSPARRENSRASECLTRGPGSNLRSTSRLEDPFPNLLHSNCSTYAPGQVLAGQDSVSFSNTVMPGSCT